jgi:hypothetical protein
MTALTTLNGSGDNVGMDFTSAYAEHNVEMDHDEYEYTTYHATAI